MAQKLSDTGCRAQVQLDEHAFVVAPDSAHVPLLVWSIIKSFPLLNYSKALECSCHCPSCD